MSEPTPYVYPPDPEQPGTNPPGPSKLRRHRILLIVAGVIIVLVGVGSGLALAATHGADGHPAADPTTSQSPTPSPTSSAQHGKNGAKRHAMRATILRESGSTWTVRSLAGQTVQVTINADTKFGTMAAPATRSTFTVGKAVVINGAKTSSGVTARRVRIAELAQKQGTGTPSTTPSATPSPSAS